MAASVRQCGVGHVWDLARELPLAQAVAKAIPETSRAITIAGVTLAVSFGLLMVVPLRPFRELGFVMAVGILIDALIVRGIMTPCLLTVVGTKSGWPGRRFSRLNVLHSPAPGQPDPGPIATAPRPSP